MFSISSVRFHFHGISFSPYLSDDGVGFLLSIADTGERHQPEPEALHEGPGLATSALLLRKVDEAADMEHVNRLSVGINTVQLGLNSNLRKILR